MMDENSEFGTTYYESNNDGRCVICNKKTKMRYEGFPVCFDDYFDGGFDNWKKDKKAEMKFLKRLVEE